MTEHKVGQGGGVSHEPHRDLHREADQMVGTLLRELHRRRSWAQMLEIFDTIRMIRLQEKSMELERRHLSGEPNIYGPDGIASKEMNTL